MKMHFGYSDGSGDYYITVDSDKCNGCRDCVKACPQQALEVESVFIDPEDKTVASVKEEYRRKIKYTCSSCKPENGITPCSTVCKLQAVKCSWTQH